MRHAAREATDRLHFLRVAQLRFDPPALGDVDRQHHHPLLARLDAQLETTHQAIGVAELVRQPRRGALVHAAPELREHRRPLDAGIHLLHAAADQLARFAAAVLAGRVVQVHVAPLAVDHLNALAQRAEHEAQIVRTEWMRINHSRTPQGCGSMSTTRWVLPITISSPLTSS
jgi:hypothetical protein